MDVHRPRPHLKFTSKTQRFHGHFMATFMGKWSAPLRPLLAPGGKPWSPRWTSTRNHWAGWRHRAPYQVIPLAIPWCFFLKKRHNKNPKNWKSNRKTHPKSEKVLHPKLHHQPFGHHFLRPRNVPRCPRPRHEVSGEVLGSQLLPAADEGVPRQSPLLQPAKEMPLFYPIMIQPLCCWFLLLVISLWLRMFRENFGREARTNSAENMTGWFNKMTWLIWPRSNRRLVGPQDCRTDIDVTNEN